MAKFSPYCPKCKDFKDVVIESIEEGTFRCTKCNFVFPAAEGYEEENTIWKVTKESIYK